MNSGAEANECAIKLARRYGQLHGGPERYHVISAYGSFHGRTLATLAATGQPQKQETFAPLPSGFRQVAFADLDALEAAMDDRVCAVLLESVQGEGGVQPAPVEYLQGVRRLCDEREALLIIDEVQTGLGRTGRWFGFEHAGVAPDIVTLAKALGNGMPIGACWARAEVAAAFRPGDHATTFGGQPLAASAARAVLAEMQAIDAPALARAARRAAHGRARGPARGRRRCAGPGLLIAAELARRLRRSRKSTRACLDAGVVVNGVTPTRAAARAAAHWSPTPRSTKRSRSSVGSWPAVADRAAEEAAMTRDFLDVDELDPAASHAHPRPGRGRAATIPTTITPVLAGLGVAALFEKPSARTRTSFEMAVVALGGHPVVLRGEEVQPRRPRDGRRHRPHARVLLPR